MDKTHHPTTYYEQPQLWGYKNGVSPQEQERIDRTLSLIPDEARSVLDIGCGDGRLTNRLSERHPLACGIDTSREALRHVAAAKCLASIDRLPFRDKSFDLAICCEVLEHLPVETYSAALKEIQRTASGHILITVPNAEDLKQQMVTCPACCCTFHLYRHVRSFTPKQMHGLLDAYEVATIQLCGEIAAYPRLFIRLARLLNLSDYGFPATAICPQCGYTHRRSINADTVAERSNPFKESFLRLSRFVANKLMLFGKRHIWLMALYQSKAHKE